MPELPEVECLTRQVKAEIEGRTFGKAAFLRADLRDPIPIGLWRELLDGKKVISVFRRSKYMVWQTERGFGVIHLGMTGNVLLKKTSKSEIAHTHAIFEFKEGKALKYLHYVDPRRFGRITCFAGVSYDEHELFRDLGPEPLQDAGLGSHLYQVSRKKKSPVKVFLMDPRVVVGVGNIYASESLFRAGINPNRSAGDITISEYQSLAKAVKKTLEQAIKSGGTTFRDYKAVDGSNGYFAVKLKVYGKEGDACERCGSVIKLVKQGGRSTFYCDSCQK